MQDFSSNDQPEVDQHIQEDSDEMERLRIEERFFANFEAVPDCSEGNGSFESLKSFSSYDSELVVSDFTVSATPSPNICGRSSNNSSLSSIGHEGRNTVGRERKWYRDRVERCFSFGKVTLRNYSFFDQSTMCEKLYKF